MKQFAFFMLIGLLVASCLVECAPFSFRTSVTDLKQEFFVQKELSGGHHLSIPDGNSVVEYMKGILSGKIALSVVLNRVNETEDVTAVLARMKGSAVLAVIAGEPRQSEPSFTIEASPEARQLVPLLPHMQRMYSMLSDVMPHGLLPMHISVRPLHVADADGVVGVVFDVASSSVYANADIVQYLDHVPLPQLASAYERYTHVIENATARMQPGDDATTLLRYIVVDVRSLFDSSVVFCVACVAVLSVLFPYVVNYALINLALAVCRDMGWQVTAEYCVALWSSAIALGLIGLPAIAYVIFILCRVQSCANA